MALELTLCMVVLLLMELVRDMVPARSAAAGDLQ